MNTSTVTDESEIKKILNTKEEKVIVVIISTLLAELSTKLRGGGGGPINRSCLWYVIQDNSRHNIFICCEKMETFILKKDPIKLQTILTRENKIYFYYIASFHEEKYRGNAWVSRLVDKWLIGNLIHKLDHSSKGELSSSSRYLYITRTIPTWRSYTNIESSKKLKINWVRL